MNASRRMDELNVFHFTSHRKRRYFSVVSQCTAAQVQQ